MILIFIKLLSIIIAVCVFIKLFSFTPHIKNGISEIKKIRIGKLDQSVLIRGENINNPVLLYLHGGPGLSEMIPFRSAHRKLEKYFTVVIWEQRGTGKSFSADIPKESMTIDQFLSDAHELIEYLKKEFKKEKILVVGHSWGTALGMLLISKYSESFYAYVGSGQMVNPKEGEKLGYRYLMEKAEGNTAAIKELAELNSPEPYLTIDKKGKWFDKIKTERKRLIKFGGEIYNSSSNSPFINLKTFTAPEYSLPDFIKFGRGSTFSLKEMWPEIMNLDFINQIPSVNIPVFFLQGKHDYNTPSALAEKYFNSLKAPVKELIWFENSAHHPMYEEPEKYDDYMIKEVLLYCR